MHAMTTILGHPLAERRRTAAGTHGAATATLGSMASSISGGRLDNVDLETLARRVPTPFYAYSATTLDARIDALRSATESHGIAVRYAVKANATLALLQRIAEAGFGADIVSIGELERCLRVGIPADRIVYSGVGKTTVDIATALAAGVECLNVESLDELQTIERIAEASNRPVRVAARINPDVDAGSHAKISTGRAEDKFGVSPAEARAWFAREQASPLVRLDGLHVHIGSQILDLAPFHRAFAQVAQFARELAALGHPIASIDVGGGLGVAYRDGQRPPGISEYMDTVRTALSGFSGRILVEPGRWLVADAGVLVARVIRVKNTGTRRFLILDAAMNDFARPSLYDAWHAITPLAPRDGAPLPHDIVGPVCETGDTFARDRLLPPCHAGDLVLIHGTGAYGTSMSSNYNTRPRIAEVLLQDGRYAIIRRRQTFDELIAGEQPAHHWEPA